MTKQYVISGEQIKEAIDHLECGFDDDSDAMTVLMLQSLPKLTGNPVCHVRARIASTHWNSFEIVPRDMDNAFPVYTHARPPQPLANEPLEELLGQYWDAAYKEGKTGLPQSTAANAILHKLRQLLLQPEDDGSDWFYKLKFIRRVLGNLGKAPKEDWQTAYGMARSLQCERWQAEKQMQPLTDKPDCIYTRCADDSATPNTLESGCDGAVLWYLGDDGDGEYPRFCHHCGGAVKEQA